MSVDGNGGTFMDTCHRIMLPYDVNKDPHAINVKPNVKVLFGSHNPKTIIAFGFINLE
ncbi:hypothetical protein REPUB_Repub15cG0114100 [Reevesia pubescens]